MNSAAHSSLEDSRILDLIGKTKRLQIKIVLTRISVKHRVCGFSTFKSWKQKGFREKMRYWEDVCQIRQILKLLDTSKTTKKRNFICLIMSLKTAYARDVTFCITLLLLLKKCIRIFRKLCCLLSYFYIGFLKKLMLSIADPYA